MKKSIFMGFAAMMLCGSVYATSWRVCTKPEAGANFLTVAEAVASNSVFAGDTLYIEPGHMEPSDIDITKQLYLIGPGYYFNDNNINVMDSRHATFSRSVTLSAEHTSITGCVLLQTLFMQQNTTVNRCAILCSGMNAIVIRGGHHNMLIEDNYIVNDISFGSVWSDGQSGNNTLIQNNIINGCIANASQDISNSLTIRNNTIVPAATGQNLRRDFRDHNGPQVFTHLLDNSQIYNNIIIRMDDRFFTITNANQTVDTFFAKDFIFPQELISNNSIHNNILSSTSVSGVTNCIFNASVEDVLIWNGATTLEEKYKHKANGPAVGAGVNGTTCGAYGTVNGGRAYQPAGIPQYRPYIYDANIDDTPSSNNTINASFKIKVQQ